MSDETVKKWILKAENDLKIGKDEFSTSEPATYIICFHMQQCIEKYLKAFLVSNTREVRRTNDIDELIELCGEIDSEFQRLLGIDLVGLTDYAVEVRYMENRNIIKTF